jgi:hypothetical protein
MKSKHDDAGISLRELFRRLGRAVSGLSRLAAAGRLPRLANGSFDEAACRVALGGVEPGRGRRGKRAVLAEASADIKTRDDASRAVALVAQVLREEGADSKVIDYMGENSGIDPPRAARRS